MWQDYGTHARNVDSWYICGRFHHWNVVMLTCIGITCDISRHNLAATFAVSPSLHEGFFLTGKPFGTATITLQCSRAQTKMFSSFCSHTVTVISYALRAILVPLTTPCLTISDVITCSRTRLLCTVCAIKLLDWASFVLQNTKFWTNCNYSKGAQSKMISSNSFKAFKSERFRETRIRSIDSKRSNK